MIEAVGGRCGVGVLVETVAAVEAVEELALLPLSRVYVGLNDLSIDRGTASLFDAIADGTVERVVSAFDVPFGFGGLTEPELGDPVPCRLLIAEMARLRCILQLPAAQLPPGCRLGAPGTRGRPDQGGARPRRAARSPAGCRGLGRAARIDWTARSRMSARAPGARSWLAAGVALTAALWLADMAAGIGTGDEAWWLQIAGRLEDGDAPYADFFLGVLPLPLYATSAATSVLGLETLGREAPDRCLHRGDRFAGRPHRSGRGRAFFGRDLRRCGVPRVRRPPDGHAVLAAVLLLPACLPRSGARVAPSGARRCRRTPHRPVAAVGRRRGGSLTRRQADGGRGGTYRLARLGAHLLPSASGDRDALSRRRSRARRGGADSRRARLRRWRSRGTSTPSASRRSTRAST